jgi:hypothetical protein
VAVYQRGEGAERVVVLNNLSDRAIRGWFPETAPAFRDMLTGREFLPGDQVLEPYEFLWLQPLGAPPPNAPSGPNAPQPGYLGSDKQ